MLKKIITKFKLFDYTIRREMFIQLDKKKMKKCEKNFVRRKNDSVIVI